MYITKKQTKYYIYDCVKKKQLCTCADIGELIKYVAQYNRVPFWSKKVYNPFLEDFNCTGKDMRCVSCSEFDIEEKYVLKEYIVFDDMFRVIDVRAYEKEILEYDFSKNHKKKPFSWMSYFYGNSLPEFRKGPVPRTGKIRWGFRNYYRKPRTTQERRINCDPEHKQYMRKRRNYIPTIYDDIPRNQYRSWKHQSKKRKQWM